MVNCPRVWETGTFLHKDYKPLIHSQNTLEGVVKHRGCSEEKNNMGDVKNQYYKEFLDGFLLNEISRQDIIKVVDSIVHQHTEQARALVIIAWTTGARPNEYLRLTPEYFSRSADFLEIKMPSSKGSSARIISLPRYYKDSKEDDPLTKEVFEYQRTLFPKQWLFWFFRSDAIRYGVTKKYKNKDGKTVEKHYDKIYNQLSKKLPYYFSKWFDCLFPDGVPPYYLRHNRATKVYEAVGSGGTMETFGWRKEETMKKYMHKTKKMREEIGKALIE